LLGAAPMRIPLSWLAEFVTWSGPAAALAERLTMAGLKIEAIEEVGQLDRRIVAGRLAAVEPHPEADRVQVCRVEVGRPAPLVAVSRESGAAAAREVRVRVEAADLCPRYCARVVRGVAIVPSPLWVRLRLRRAGMRALNAVVDATNYVMLERGQPLHAFDLERLAERRIVVRRGASGERLTTLDGVERALEPDDLVIADGRGPVALAGVMGGEASEVTPATRVLLLESAFFAPASVREEGAFEEEHARRRRHLG